MDGFFVDDKRVTSASALAAANDVEDIISKITRGQAEPYNIPLKELVTLISFTRKAVPFIERVRDECDDMVPWDD